MGSRHRSRAFSVEWTAEQREAIRCRVAEYPMPAAPAGEGWAIGCDADFLARLREHWLQNFDWDAAVERLNRFPQYLVEIDGQLLHYVRILAERADAPALLLIHGWPSSHFEFFEVADRLANPSRHGGRAEDTVEIIVPSLPGYGFSGKPKEIIGPQAVARLFHRLMTEELGHDHYYSHGGDWGAVVSSWLAIQNPDAVKGIHLGMIALPVPAHPETAEEQSWASRHATVQREMGGYSHLQGSKPQSLAWLAAGNPVGQAAWIVERYHDWSDLTRRTFEAVYDLDWLLTSILIYVMNESFASAAYLYNGLARESGGSVTTLGKGETCPVPTAFTNRLSDPRVIPPPRQRVEKVYNLVRWRDADRGGHFPAHEVADDFVADLTEWIRSIRH